MTTEGLRVRTFISGDKIIFAHYWYQLVRYCGPTKAVWNAFRIFDLCGLPYCFCMSSRPWSAGGKMFGTFTTVYCHASPATLGVEFRDKVEFERFLFEYQRACDHLRGAYSQLEMLCFCGFDITGFAAGTALPDNAPSLYVLI